MGKRVVGRWVLDLPHHTARVNELLSSVKARIRLKKRDRNTVGWCCKFARVPPAEGKRRVDVCVVLGFRQRGGDPDSYFKSLLDALVACGCLVDDSHEWVELGEVTYSRGGRPGMVVTVSDVPEGVEGG